MSGMAGYLHPDGSTEKAGYLSVTFPGNEVGSYDCTTMENAIITWMDIGANHTFTVMKDQKGVNGTIDVNRCRNDALTGFFSGKLGWWEPGRNPQEDPPSDTVKFEKGSFRYTGKLQSGGFAPQRFAAARSPAGR
jgi:hypothetical protein